MVPATRFWPLYFVASVTSVALTLIVFRLLLAWPMSYEDATVIAALFAMPVNWLVGEQLTWGVCASSRRVRAARYYVVYSVGLLIEVLTVHVLGHEILINAHAANAIAVGLSLLWTAPLNRRWTWAQDVGRRVRRNDPPGAV
ncbi:MAG: GtrA family protein [Bacilli bacterium]